MDELQKLQRFKDLGWKYESETGKIFDSYNRYWRHKTKEGYIRCNGVLGHRLAWFLYYNERPPKFIDHINRIKDDNRICNLRDVTQRENNQNIDKSKKSSKYIGVSYIARIKRWRAYTKINGIQINFGCFKTEEEAYLAYLNNIKNFS